MIFLSNMWRINSFNHQTQRVQMEKCIDEIHLFLDYILTVCLVLMLNLPISSFAKAGHA